MALIYDRNGLTVRDAPTDGLGGPAVNIFTHPATSHGTRHDAQDMRDLRDELTDWLQRVGRDS